MTTSRVAEVAGVSVGTLYQYFAHREAIVEALQERELERAGAMLERVLQSDQPLSDRELSRAVVEELLRLYRAAPALHRVLAVDGLRFSPPERVLAFDARSVALLKAFLTLAGPRIRATNLEAAAFVVYQSVRATMLSYLPRITRRRERRGARRRAHRAHRPILEPRRGPNPLSVGLLRGGRRRQAIEGPA